MKRPKGMVKRPRLPIDSILLRVPLDAIRLDPMAYAGSRAYDPDSDSDWRSLIDPRD